jgi:hypothetical protein
MVVQETEPEYAGNNLVRIADAYLPMYSELFPRRIKYSSPQLTKGVGSDVHE